MLKRLAPITSVPAPGKNEAVILDHVGNAHRHGLPTDEREWNLAGRRRREGVSIPIRDCPVCFCSCPSDAQVCPAAATCS